MKCLPASKLTEAKGVAIHDWHAEILAIRTFNRFLLDECQTLVESLNNEHESILQRHDSKDDVDPTSRRCTRPFKVKEDVKLHMYCSEAPCKFFKLSWMRSSECLDERIV
jgi:tRNA-specific adenosine deaminase 1